MRLTFFRIQLTEIKEVHLGMAEGKSIFTPEF